MGEGEGEGENLRALKGGEKKWGPSGEGVMDYLAFETNHQDSPQTKQQ